MLSSPIISVMGCPFHQEHPGTHSKNCYNQHASFWVNNKTVLDSRNWKGRRRNISPQKLRCKPSKVLDLKQVKVTPVATASQKLSWGNSLAAAGKHPTMGRRWQHKQLHCSRHLQEPAPDLQGKITALLFTREGLSKYNSYFQHNPTCVGWESSQGVDGCVGGNQLGSESKPSNDTKIEFILECARYILKSFIQCWFFCYRNNDSIP